MKQFTFTSQLAPIIWKYLESRQNEGYTSVHCGYYMQELDCLSKELSDAPVVTKELIDAWDLLKPYLSNRSKIYDNFRELLFACNIPHTGNGPRVHDFRHTFAVHTLEKQLSDGYDPMVIVPRLAAYLGHKSYRETCWYIHLTVASFPELSQKLDRAFVGIIPVGGETDEEN